MIGSFLSSGLVLIFGYVYPAYECYKIVERNKPDVEQLRFWCQYWILVAVLAVFERIGEIFISWVPMYSEAKLAFYIYLWYPKTKGTSYVYDSFLRPFLEKNETEIDRNLLELRTRAGDMAVFYFQKAASYSQARFFEIMQFIASQPFPRPYQNQGNKTAHKHTAASKRQAPKPQVEEPPPSPISSSSSSQDEEEVSSTEAATAPASPVAKKVPSKLIPPLRKRVQHSNPESPANSSLKKSTTPEPPESASESGNEADSDQQPKKAQAPVTVLEDTIRETRGRLRKSRSIADTDA